MIAERNQNRLAGLGKFADAGGDRSAHFAIRIWVDCKAHLTSCEAFSNFLRPMPYDNDYRFHATSLKIVNAAFDHCFVSKRKQGLERSHTTGLSGGEENCCYVIHNEVKSEDLLRRAVCIDVPSACAIGRRSQCYPEDVL